MTRARPGGSDVRDDPIEPTVIERLDERHSRMSEAPAGWYPQADGTERFWSGVAWTDQSRPPPAGPQSLVSTAPAQLHAGWALPIRAGAVYQPVVAPKSPGLALLASFFIPGLGQLINGEAAKGILMFFGYLFSYVLMFVLIGFLTAPAIWIWAMVDAYTGAQRWNLERGIVS
jgi:TM2 domain-containing membrane protein YozV